MLHFVFVLILSLLPTTVQSSCCHLPFTNGDCQVHRQGPHRYQIMPDRQSGLVQESTECIINDYDATYRKVVETKNPCNECPGLLILHANSSDIFLFPEYLERILEGRTPIQRKNVVILTTSLVGAYDLDFTFLARYYASRPVDEVPSLYIDLQLPKYDSKQTIEPNLRLRLPTYENDREGLLKISRQDLLNPTDVSRELTENFHRLPYLYHFDINIHRSQPNLCTLFDVEVKSNGLTWKTLDSGAAVCHSYMPYFGLNKCLATGFARLFCAIEENVSKDDRLRLSPYLKTTNQVEHLTIAVTGGRRVDMAITNDQTRPAQQIKILLLQGHLTVTDINDNLPIRVEYGSDCNEYSLSVPEGFSATRYRRFDGDNLVIYEGNGLVKLPPCFRVVPSAIPVQTSKLSSTIQSPLLELESEEKHEITTEYPSDSEIPIDLNITNILLEDEPDSGAKFLEIFKDKNTLIYAIIGLLILVALIPLCIGVFYRVYWNEDRRAEYKLDQINHSDTPNQTNVSLPFYVNHATQTTDTPIRI